MPSEWRARSFGELVENLDALRVPVKSADRRPGPFPYYGASGVVDYVDQFIFDGEHLLIAEDGENLRTRKTPIAFLARGKFWVNNHAHIVRANSEADTRFLMYYLAHADVSGFLTGSTMPKLTQRALHQIPVNAPPPDEQRRIAGVLGALDDKIELNRKMNRTLEEMAQAIFKSWFIDFDGVPQSELVDSELGPIPRGWDVKPLDTIADFLNGAACQKYPAMEGDLWLPVIKIRELNQGVTEATDRATADIPRKWWVEDGDVLFSWSGSLVVKLWSGGPGALNQHLFKVTSQDHPKWFYLLWTQRHLPTFQQIAADKATTMGHIKRHHLADALCTVPPAPVMRQLSELLDPLIQRVLACDIEARTLASLRDLLLPKLISGELRVPEAEKAVEAVL